MHAEKLNVAMIGAGFMGKAHSHAWRTATRFFDLPIDPVLDTLVGTDDARTRTAAQAWGWGASTTDWRTVVEDDRIDIVDIVTPGDTHAEMAIAALAAGKHVLCEKPLANSVGDARMMVEAAATAAAAAGSISMCGFSYRRTPALALAREIVGEGRLGEIRHIRAQYLQDWLSDAAAPLTWRLDAARAGSGALGDIAAHSIDTAQWVSGQQIAEVSAVLRTFVRERPVLAAHVGLGGTADTDAARGPVTVDDAVAFTAQFDAGALGTFEASRVATGRRNANRIEINGERGSISFDFERMNELSFFEVDQAGAALEGFRTIHVTGAEHPYTANWWPVGHGIGYEHLFTHQVVDFLEAIVSGVAPTPSFADALGVQRVLDAVSASASARSAMTTVEGTQP